ncbi:hypothetical protein, partial [Hymenobacter terrestris]|uniref:hypothetical protein n=1 Tax=Hymenobacter terrestris TaxID=2748310 RepID=UPI001C409E61
SIKLKNPFVNNEILNSYKSMRKQNIEGDGKLNGDWQIELMFVLKDSSRIHSFIFCNSNNSLVFISDNSKNNFDNFSLNDCLVNSDISKIVINEISKR